MSKRYWQIRGYDNTKTIFETKVDLGQFTKDQIQDVLRALAGRAGLTFDEIVGAYAKRRTKIANDLLDVQHDRRRSTYLCGSNPHFAASLVDESGKIIVHPNNS
jgi:hypothetical protein